MNLLQNSKRDLITFIVMILACIALYFYLVQREKLDTEVMLELTSLKANVYKLESEIKKGNKMEVSKESKNWIDGFVSACRRAKDILTTQTPSLYEREGRQVLDDAWSQIDKLEKTAFQEMPTVISRFEEAPEEVGQGLLQVLERNETPSLDTEPQKN